MKSIFVYEIMFFLFKKSKYWKEQKKNTKQTKYMDPGDNLFGQGKLQKRTEKDQRVRGDRTDNRT